MSTDFETRARRLRNAVEPVAAGVYFAPEAHAAYEAHGIDGSPLDSPDGIARPELKSYFPSRGACMRHVPGEVVASAFGCFNPNGRCWTRSAATWTSSSSTSTRGPRRIIAGGSYPKRIAGVFNVGGAPHFGSGLTIDTAADQYEHEV